MIAIKEINTSNATVEYLDYYFQNNKVKYKFL